MTGHVLEQKVERCSFSIDSSLVIVKADNALCRFLNESAPVTLKSYITPAAEAKFKQFLQKLMDDITCPYALPVSVRRKERLTLLYIRRHGSIYDTVMYDTAYLGEDLDYLLFRNRQNTAILSCLNVAYFLYDLSADTITVSSTRELGSVTSFQRIEITKKLPDQIAQKTGMRCFANDTNKIEWEHLSRDLLQHVNDRVYHFTCENEKKLSLNTIANYSSFNVKEQIIGVFGNEGGEILSPNVGGSMDGLTFVLNKTAITDYAMNNINVSHKTTTLMIIDVDNFKHLNDTYGHAFGDDVLVRFSRILTSSAGALGKVGRFGGDEFMVVLDGIDDIPKIREIAGNIRLGIEWAYIAEHPELMLSCSIGIARSPVDGVTYDEIFALADKTLYIAKRKGKNCYVYYNPVLHAHINVTQDALEKGQAEDQNLLSGVHNELTILQILISRKENWFRASMILLMNELSLMNITLYRYKDGLFTLEQTISGGPEARAGFLTQRYLQHFSRNGVLINDNTLSYEAVNHALYTMYSDHGITSTIEVMLRSPVKARGLHAAGEESLPGPLLGLVCFDRGKPARCWTEKERNLILMVAELLERVLSE